MSTINILCVIDAESLVKKYPAAANSRQTLNHTQLHPYARMIAKQDDVLASQASDDLSIKVKQGDTVKWRAVSLTDDREYQVDIDGFSSVDTGFPPFELGNTDTWQTMITQLPGSGKDAYWVSFSVKDPNGKRYQFNWDPYITVV
ncbi:AidA/PixA family protein [Geitlerinema sp. CS-897]|nr:AidA/PixA family protein [Geitlerinema sp. CS-897]